MSAEDDDVQLAVGLIGGASGGDRCGKEEDAGNSRDPERISGKSMHGEALDVCRVGFSPRILEI
jgi:hypothetical protein